MCSTILPLPGEDARVLQTGGGELLPEIFAHRLGDCADIDTAAISWGKRAKRSFTWAW